MRAFGIIMAVLATVICPVPAGAQDAAPESSVSVPQPPLVKDGPPEPREAHKSAVRETAAAPEQRWRWSAEGGRPALEFRVSERATLRLRGNGLFLNLRF